MRIQTRQPREILVIVPARNESLNISACIEGLTRQTYPSGKRVVRIVDDHSNDDTAQIARAAASPHAGFSVVASPPLPPRWVGKCHACWVGATRDIDDPPEWLCFIDADVVAEPELLAAALQHAEAQSVDLLSLAPKQILGTWTERLVLPCGLYCLSFCQDFERLRTDECRDTSVTGQFLLVRAEAYYAVGGHRAVSDAICEDLALARQFKQHGRRIALFGGRELLSSRMYRDWSSMKIGLAKNLVETFGGSCARPGLHLALSSLPGLLSPYRSWTHGDVLEGRHLPVAHSVLRLPVREPPSDFISRARAFSLFRFGTDSCFHLDIHSAL
ncbi:glycosyltransferase [Methylocystis sp. IM2]|uniref:glycosyltransferase n=1 Tax=Methylocystis sp. IM2 TaxID=3136563 RepID=UPI004047E70A